MNSFHTKLGSLFRKSKSKKIILLLIIISSVSLMTFCAITIQSVIHSVNENYYQIYGEHHVTVINTDIKMLYALNKQPQIDIAGIVTTVGYANDSSNFVIGHVDENAFLLNRLVLVKGRMPTNNNEIAIDESKCYKMGIEPILNTTISLSIKPFNEETSYSSNTYKLVGIIEDTSKKWHTMFRDYTKSFPNVYISNEEANKYAVSGSAIHKSYLKLKKHYANKQDINMLQRRYGTEDLPWTNLNTYVNLDNDTAFDSYDLKVVFYKYRLAFMLGLLFLVLLLSYIFFIFMFFTLEFNNEFNNIGLLRAIGATAQQLAKIQLNHILSCFITGMVGGLTIGVFLSYTLQNYINSITYYTYLLNVNLKSLIALIILIAILIMFLSFRVLLKICSISPIKGMKFHVNNKAKPNKIKNEKMSFNSLLLKNLKLNKMKSALIIFITTLTLSVCLCLLSNNLVLKYNYFGKTYYEYELLISGFNYGSFMSLTPVSEVKNVFNEDTLKKVIQVSGVKQVIAQQSGHCSQYKLVLTNEQISDYFANLIPDYEREFRYRKESSYEDWRQSLIKLGLNENQTVLQSNDIYFNYTISCNDYQLRKLEPYFDQGSLNLQALEDGDEVIVCLPPYQVTRGTHHYVTSIGETKTLRTFQGKHNQYQETSLKPGDKITLARLVKKPNYVPKENDINIDSLQIEQQEVTIGAIIHESGYKYLGNDIYFLNEQTPSIIFHNKALQKWSGQEYYNRIRVILEPDANSEQVELDLEEIVKWHDKAWLFSREKQSLFTENEKKENEIVFLAISLCVGLINILAIYYFIMSNMQNRKRQFGILRAVGMSKKQLKKILLYESLIFTIVSTVLASIICVVYAYWHYDIINNIRIIVDWYYTVPWLYIPLFGVLMTGLIYIMSIASINQYVNESITNNIRKVD